jgi:hypothetical protein
VWGLLPWLLGLLQPLSAVCLAASPSSDPSKPITLSGSESVVWTEGNYQVILLRGPVTVEQGLLRVQMARAVAWVELGRAEREKPLTVMVYGEGDVLVDQEGRRRREAQLFLELQTSEEVRLKDHKRTPGPATEDPLYLTAVRQRQVLLAERMETAVPRSAVVPAGMPPPARLTTVEVLPPAWDRPAPVPESDPPGPTAFSRDRPRRILITPRFSTGYRTEFREIDGEQVAIVTGGVTITVEDLLGAGLVDISTDRAVIWTRNLDGQRLLQGAAQDQTTQAPVEIYLEGHVEIRQSSLRGPEAGVTRLLRADQVYYDVRRNVALLVHAELAVSVPRLPETIHVRAREIRQVAEGRFEADEAVLYASRLPSDPDLTLQADFATVEERKVPARSWLGRPLLDPVTGQPQLVTQLWATADDVTLRAWEVPLFYVPHVEGDLRDPLGPLEQVRFRTDRVFGVGILVDWDMFQLLGGAAPPNTRWTLETDYLSRRGPALGTQLLTRGFGLFGIPGSYASELRGYLIYDNADTDILGGPREFGILDPWRGRFLARHRQELGEEFTVLAQVSYLSDRNFLEQFYKREFDNDLNQETYFWLQQQADNWIWTLNVQPHIRPWVTETAWLPRLNGYLLGQSLFDRLSYFVHASAGWANFHPTSDIPRSFFAEVVPDEFARFRLLPPSTDYPHNPRVDLARVDLWQELDLPLSLGPLRLVPYGIFDVSYWSQTLAEEDGTARLYGGGGVRAALPLSRVYPDLASDLFNVQGIAHKLVFHADYGYFLSDVGFRELVPLDRLDDDATDQARRDLRALRLMTALPGSNDRLLASSPRFDPQLYALRRGLIWNIENLDDLQALRFGVEQRWQTKRGFPGQQHILDWMVLDLEATWFPDADRDNFGHPFAFVRYDYTWNIGDRTTLTSIGWLDPFPQGARYLNVGLFLDRPERLQYYVGFTTIEPVGTAAVILSSRYAFNDKWSGAFTTTYDFGDQQNLGNALVLTRTGSDLQVSVGVTYQPLQNNFGVVFEVLPSLASSGLGKRSGLGLGTAGGLLGGR